MSRLYFKNEPPPETLVDGVPLPEHEIHVTVEEGKRMISSDSRLYWGPTLHRLEPPMRIKHIFFQDQGTIAARW